MAGDRVGFGVVMLIHWQSLQQGKNEESIRQFNKNRKHRSFVSGIKCEKGWNKYFLDEVLLSIFIFLVKLKPHEQDLMDAESTGIEHSTQENPMKTTHRE